MIFFPINHGYTTQCIIFHTLCLQTTRLPDGPTAGCSSAWKEDPLERDPWKEGIPTCVPCRCMLWKQIPCWVSVSQSPSQPPQKLKWREICSYQCVFPGYIFFLFCGFRFRQVSSVLQKSWWMTEGLMENVKLNMCTYHFRLWKFASLVSRAFFCSYLAGHILVSCTVRKNHVHHEAMKWRLSVLHQDWLLCESVHVKYGEREWYSLEKLYIKSFFNLQ